VGGWVGAGGRAGAPGLLLQQLNPIIVKGRLIWPRSCVSFLSPRPLSNALCCLPACVYKQEAAHSVAVILPANINNAAANYNAV